MSFMGWLQIAFVLGCVVAAARPLGLYMARVFQGQRTPVSWIIKPVEKRVLAAAGVKAAREQTWFAYAAAMLLFYAAGFVLL